MGIFSKIGKGIKKVFKKIGKAIKKGFKKFGKFMGKIGILGQIAMSFILPGIGGALMKGIGSTFSKIVGKTAVKAGTKVATDAATTAATKTAAEVGTKAAAKEVAGKAVENVATKAVEGSGMLGSKSALVRGAGKVLEAAGNFVGTGVKAFKTVTEGISSFIGEFSKTALNKIPGINIGSAAPTMGDAWQNVQNSVMQNASGTVEAFNKTLGIDPVKGATDFGTAGYKVPENVTMSSQIQKGISVDKIKPETQGLDLSVSAESPAQLDRLGQLTEQAANKNKLDSLLSGEITPTELVPSVKPFDPIQPVKGRSLLDYTIDTPTIKAYEPTGISAQLEGAQFKDNFKAIMDGTSTAPPIKVPDDPRFLKNEVKRQIGGSSTASEAAKDLGFFGQLGKNIKDVPGKIQESLLNAPNKIANIPEQFVDNLTSTITGLPAAAAKAALNRAPDQTVNQYQYVASAIPENTFGTEQAQAGAGLVPIESYQNRSASGNLFGSNAYDAYGQFFKLVS